MFNPDDIKKLGRVLKDRTPLNLQDETPHVGSDMEANGLDGRDDRPYLRRHRGIREASVLVPIVEREDGYYILLTQRGDHLPDHPGQVSFPGGSREAEDKDEIATALRETWEEVGIGAEHIDIIGSLKPYHTVTGFQVSPIVGILRPDFTLKVDENEVKDVFEVPLIHILNKDTHEKHSREFQGQTRHFFAMPYNGYYIWGATAAMLVNLSHSLFAHINLNKKG